MAKLILANDPENRAFPLADQNTVGRLPSSNIRLTDPLVSGRHAYILFDQGTWQVRDLGSSNGTFINGVRVEHAVLKPGDVIQFGSTHVTFSQEEDGQASNNVKMQASQDAPHIHSRVDGSGSAKFLPADRISDIEQLKRDYEKLRIANEINQAIGLEPDIEVLLSSILNEAFKVLTADRGVILLMEPKSRELVPRAVKHRDNSDEEIVLSSTVINEVFGSGAAVLTSDATLDSRFSAAKSVMAMGLRSTMCVPMIFRSQLYGIIHLDTLYARGAFSEKDLQILTGLAAQAARAIDNTYKARELERNALARRDFERLLPPEIVEQVVTGKVQLKRGGELRDTTVLFSDIRGFTSWSESHDPGHIVSILNDYFELMVDAIHRYQGTLDKFMGDGIMALFGAPISHEQDALNAVSCALDMLENLEKLNSKLRESGNQEIAIGIGINTGPVIAGYMGSTKSMEYTTIGDHVNLAARLCGVAEPGQILLSENTKSTVEREIHSVALPPVSVKGKSNPIPIFQVMGRRSAWEETTNVTKTPTPGIPRDPSRG